VAFATALGLLAGPPARLAADVPTGVNGTVTDMHGAAIESALVTLTCLRGGAARVRTDALGSFRFPSQAPGASYALSIEAEGYRTVVYEGFRLETARTRRFEVRLKRPGDRDVVVLLSRDPYPFEDLMRGILQNLDAPVRVINLDKEDNPGDTVRRLAAEKPNLILGTGLLSARLIRRDVRDIPAIMTLISDPRRYDLQAVNVTYIATNPPPDELIRRVREFVPGARRLGVVFDSEASTLVARDIRQAARKAGFTVVMRPCYSPGTLEAELDHLKDRIDVLAVPFDPVTIGEGALDAVTGWALRNRIPLAAPGPDWVRRGALFSYGATPETIGRDVSRLASQVLYGGSHPHNGGFRRPTVPFLAVNEATAVALGLALPPGVTIDAIY
jgi:putative ABC transport system substrate-binding protein